MNQERKVLIYGASGYTGKLVAESLAQRNIPFYFVGRTRSRLEAALEVVRERHDGPVDGAIVTASNSIDELLPLFEQVDVVINVAGPFMQVAWPIVEACLQGNCHYLDTTGEQDWTRAIADKYGQSFAEKGLLLAPATSYMWTAGALAAEVVLENEAIDSLDIVYQIDRGLPSCASTQSFLRMVCNEQLYLDLDEYKEWAWDTLVNVNIPYRGMPLRAFPWGGGCEPVWYKNDPRVLNCQVLTAFGEHMVDAVKEAMDRFHAEMGNASQEEKEAWTNDYGAGMSQGEPPKDNPTAQRSCIIVGGQGQQCTSQWVMNLSAPYTWTGEIAAESARLLLAGKLLKPGFQSAATAFNHRELLETFHELGFTNLPPAIGSI
ncbi:MAG: saccharopine dehydrogenase NADP-binding domain-containing protein [Halioglobus sp.]|nr:saccharopine dehydrogenase NADP-binding domain-containing protein [Halioglobus sp.]